ncbi:MAG: hypothetical protein GX895_10830 [Clostridiales bacterium]|uniref:hypothetical protein n=1 Tax=Clostridium sp. N3C TaxID=1776758 RepID=UPI00092E0853|nr:hypothetical protein [Clostridium sp. N3C]NLZ49249.1 hypothetical protein [Clostridiales bacterium]SCN24797.1 hypothetical protein N3C_1984 [Clostridium sp. N3C]
MNFFNKKTAFIAIFIIIIISAAYYNYNTYQNKDISYVIEQKLTKGVFNKYKLSSITSTEVTYSDDILAIVSVTGISKNHKGSSATYKILLEKRSNGTWKVKEVYKVK